MLMLRSELFPRYPDMVIGAVPAVMPSTGLAPNINAPLKLPALPMIAIDDTARIIAFTGIDPASLPAIPTHGAPGWYFVLIEPPTGLRFGFDPWPGGGPFLNDPYGDGWHTSAAFAQQALQPPVRVFLHSSPMVGPGHG